MMPSLNVLLLFVASLALALALGGPMIATLKRLAYRQKAYEDAPQTHQKKTGTPTMGGLLFLVALALAFVWHPSWATASIAVAGIGCGIVGFVDDLTSVRRGRNRGLGAWPKFFATVVVGVVSLALAERAMPASLADVVFSVGAFALHVPHWLWYALGLAALLSTTHAVNLTDGLDGLATGTVLPPLAVVAWLGWRAQMPDVALADAALAGSAIGFLAFNKHPARVFMGDTGSLALGGALAASAVLAGATLLLPLIGGVFVAEAVSVMVQVASFKTTKRRVFRMSPLHHHFELGGWPETKVTSRFWTASALLSLAGAAIAR
jgi:phospho-N-acetylmuramoyl-pentapeptide-transferase